VGRVGADVKMGLTSNLTLEATINPDFGQVEADPAEVNLTAFETRFPERRPFFLEGATLFNIGHPNFYYSRRVGARPVGPAAGDYVDYPTNSTIIGAAKLTGRLPSKTSVGFLTAVTAEESAEVATGALLDRREITVAPRAYFALGRVLQEFGPQASTAGLLASVVHRDFADGDPLADLQPRNAVAFAGNTTLRFAGGQYEFRAAAGGSIVSGTAKAIERVQRSSAHFAQRPDRTYSPLDPTLTSLGGWTFQANFDRTGGRHWLWGVNTKIDSENFETNDFAILNGADGWLSNATLRYRETQPGRIFRAYSVRADVNTDTTLRRLVQAGYMRSTIDLTWANFWTTSIALRRDLPQTSVSLTRGGPLMGRGPGATAVVTLGNRAGAQTRWTATSTLSRNDDGFRQQRVSTLLSVRPAPRWQVSAEPYYERLTEPQQYVSTLAGGRPETFGSRYVFAFINRSTIATQFRLGLTVKPDMNLDVYAEPFAASGRYYDYGELLAPGSRERLRYGTSGTTITELPGGAQVVTDGASSFVLPNRDFNRLSFRSNVVLKWEWRPGSTLFVVWQRAAPAPRSAATTWARATCSARSARPAPTSSSSRRRSGSPCADCILGSDPILGRARLLGDLRLVRLGEHVLEDAVVAAVHAKGCVDGLGARVRVVHVEAQAAGTGGAGFGARVRVKCAEYAQTPRLVGHVHRLNPPHRPVPPVAPFVGDEQLAHDAALVFGHPELPGHAPVEHRLHAGAQGGEVELQLFGFERHRGVPGDERLEVGRESGTDGNSGA
jgi:hypothetical protein